MAATAKTAAQSLTKLLAQTTLEDDEEILRASNDILRKSKQDSTAQHAKLIALLKLERYAEAVQLVENGGPGLKEQARLEHAYGLYKNGQLQDAVDAASSGTSRGLKHVEAQATYRLEDFSRTAILYEQLQGDPSAIDNPNDLRINSSATAAQALWAGLDRSNEHVRPSREDLEAFETSYNAACRSIARGDFGEGEVLLRRASDLCKSSDGLSKEEKANELLPILAQRIYVALALGKGIDSLTSDFSASSISDPASKLIAENNLLASSGNDNNPFLAQRNFQAALSLPKSSALFKFQQNFVDVNSRVIDLNCFKQAGVFASTSKLLQQQKTPASSPVLNSLGVVNAAARSKCDSSKRPVNAILPLLAERPNDVGLLLTIVQLYLKSEDSTSALRLLESFLARQTESKDEASKAFGQNPALIALLISIYSKRKQTPHISDALEKAAAYWEDKPDAPSSLLRAAGIELLKSTSEPDKGLASRLFARLLEQNSQDRIAQLGNIAINASSYDSPDSKDLLALPALSRQISGIDVAQLEAAGVPKAPLPDRTATTSSQSRKRAAPSTGAASTQQQPPTKKKRVRKSRLPKDYDPAKTPDPERWLPVRERSSYRPKGKKGKNKAAALTQGGISKGEESLELVGGAGSVKVEKAPQGGGKGGGKNKKKGGKKK